MKKKGQAAMEFLMTYGWAILAVLVVLGALYTLDVFNLKGKTPQTVNFPAPFPNLDQQALVSTAGTVQVAFINQKGSTISLPLNGTATPKSGTSCVATPTITGTYINGTAFSAGTNISNGQKFLLTWDCGTAGTAGDSFASDLSFYYTNTETGQTFLQTGTVHGRYQ